MHTERNRRRPRHSTGFTLVELLIAAALLAGALTAIITHTIQLGEINARAEGQVVAASIAEAVAARYAHQPPAPGTSVTSSVGANMDIPGLTADQQRLIGRYRYTLTAQADGSMKIHVQQGDDDLYALDLTTTPLLASGGGTGSTGGSTPPTITPPGGVNQPPVSDAPLTPRLPPASELPVKPPSTGAPTPPPITAPIEGPVEF